ncbi:MAG: TIGR03747 family integrating conjugative element membrane protein [Candidatus Competibacteraceae bacterium]
MSAERAPPRPAPRSGWGRLAHRLGQTLVWLLLSLCLAILLEGLGLWCGWFDVTHSQRRLDQELQYLAVGVTSRWAPPARLAARWGQALYHGLFEVTHLVDALRWLDAPPPAGAESTPGVSLRAWLHTGLQPLKTYGRVAMTTVQIVGVRLAVLALSAPVFLLVGVTALADGLVRRDRRRFSGGYESALLHHRARRCLWPLPLATAVLYLILPVQVPPAAVILPGAAVFAVALAAATFKKYL